MSKPTYSRTIIKVQGKDQEGFEVYADESRERPVALCSTEEAARRIVAGMILTEEMLMATEQDTTPDLLAKAIRLENEKAAMLEALGEIAKGEGAFSRDPLEHAGDTIDNLKSIAKAAIALAKPIP